jgi:acylphosphatase
MERQPAWSDSRIETHGRRGQILRVPIVGDHDPIWDEDFKRVLVQESAQVSGQWVRVVYNEDEVEVEGVLEGQEDNLADFIDRCVREAHMRRRRKADEQRRRANEEQERQAEAAREAGRMVERFRAHRPK